MKHNRRPVRPRVTSCPLRARRRCRRHQLRRRRALCGRSPGSGPPPVQSFTADLERLADWLLYGLLFNS